MTEPGGPESTTARAGNVTPHRAATSTKWQEKTAYSGSKHMSFLPRGVHVLVAIALGCLNANAFAESSAMPANAAMLASTGAQHSQESSESEMDLTKAAMLAMQAAAMAAAMAGNKKGESKKTASDPIPAMPSISGIVPNLPLAPAPEAPSIVEAPVSSEEEPAAESPSLPVESTTVAPEAPASAPALVLKVEPPAPPGPEPKSSIPDVITVGRTKLGYDEKNPAGTPSQGSAPRLSSVPKNERTVDKEGPGRPELGALAHIWEPNVTSPRAAKRGQEGTEAGPPPILPAEDSAATDTAEDPVMAQIKRMMAGPDGGEDTLFDNAPGEDLYAMAPPPVQKRHENIFQFASWRYRKLADTIGLKAKVPGLAPDWLLRSSGALRHNEYTQITETGAYR